MALRAERVSAGLDDLDRWLRDQVRHGLSTLPRTGYAPFEQMAARMVDAQAPGVAGLLRAIPAEFGSADWPGRVLERFAGLHLLGQAHRRIEHLPDEVAANVRARVGYPVAKADVLAAPGVRDRWYVLGLVDTVESHLETRRVWLYGSGTGRWALLLTFAAPGASLDRSVLPGQRLDATLHYYPGSGYRALVADEPVAVVEQLRVPSLSLAQARQRFAALLAVDPWAGRMPAVLMVAPVPPSRREEPWRVRDREGCCVALAGTTFEPWPLVALSGGEPIKIFGEWAPSGFRALSVLADDTGVPFSTELT